MNTEPFFRKIRSYHNISEQAEMEWTKLLRLKTYKRGEYFVSEGQYPKDVGFVVKGLFSQSYTSNAGDIVIKVFFPENRLAASVGAMLSNSQSAYNIIAIENSTILTYNFFDFKNLVSRYSDVAAFYIKYIEHHWIIEKEPMEISLRHFDAKVRYGEFLEKYPQLVKRLKKHHIASYLGITPTQLSRILFVNK
ncbi:MAG: Crp/Fnr family transcriptional regulator [Saprospiraceae bacterium]|nr:Crp/Fnr family transcriptional regulator [Candidatus Defluviibacterium haderslevense]